MAFGKVILIKIQFNLKHVGFVNVLFTVLCASCALKLAY
jgi:hypothetical protein